MRFVLLIVFMIGGCAQAQLLDEASLDTVKVYKSLEEALKNPEKVYYLKLKGEKLTEWISRSEIEKIETTQELISLIKSKSKTINFSNLD